jgi:hypothetical protein
MHRAPKRFPEAQQQADWEMRPVLQANGGLESW